MKKFLYVIVVLAMGSSLSALAFAANADWQGTTSDKWNLDANWVGGTKPDGTERAQFNYNVGGGATTIDLDTAASVGQVNFENTLGNLVSYTIGTAGDTLTLGNSGYVNVDVTDTKDDTPQTIAANVVLGTDCYFKNNATKSTSPLVFSGTNSVTGPVAATTLTLKGTNTGSNEISGIIANGTGALAVTKDEAGYWTLEGANTYTGTTTVKAGRLYAITNAAALGAGTLTMEGGELRLVSDADTNFGRNTTVAGNSSIISGRNTIGASTTLTLGTLTFNDNGGAGGYTLTTQEGDAATTSGIQKLTFGAVTLNDDATIKTQESLGGTGTGLLTLGAVTSNAHKLTLDSTVGLSTVAVTMGNMQDISGGFTITQASGLVTTGQLGWLGTAGPITVTDSQKGVTFATGTHATTVALTDTADGQTIDFVGTLWVDTAFTTAAQGYNLALPDQMTMTPAVTFTNTGTLSLGHADGDSLYFGSTTTANAPSGVTIYGEIYVDTNKTITIGAPLTIAGTASQIDTTNRDAQTGGNIAVNGAVDGAAANTQSLELKAGTTGTIAFGAGGTIGQTTTLKTLTVTSSNGATFTGAVTADTSVVLTDTENGSDIEFTGALVTPTLTTAAQGYDVELFGNGTTITNDCNFLNTGSVTLGNNAADTITFTGGLDTTGGPSGATIAGTVATTNTAMDLNATTLAAASSLTTGGGALNVASVVNGGFLLTIDAGAGTSAIAGVVQGNGGLTKNGTGTLTLSGTNTYTGVTTINAGTVRASNAAALGTGNVAHATAGTLDIGSTTLNIGGTYTQAGAATLMVAVDGTAHGSIVAAGAATVPATANLVLSVSNYVPNSTTYTIIDGAAGGAIVAPAITDNSALLTFAATTVGNDLILTATRTNSYTKIATDGNASAAGSVLEAIGTAGATGDMLTILNELDNMATSAEIAKALDTVVPVVDGGVTSVSNTVINQFIWTSMARLEEMFAQARNSETGETGVSTGSKRLKGFEAWGQGFGEYAHQKPRGLSNGYHATIWGTALGGDVPAFNEKVRLGLGGGYAQSDVNSKDNSGKTDIDSYQGTFYGGYINGDKPYYINGAFSFAYNTYKGSRNIAVGTITRTADADYDGQQYSVLFDGGYTFKTKDFRITPIASLQYLRLHLEGYTETNAGALNLDVKSQNYDMLQSGLGMKLERPFKTKSATVIPEIHVKWLYDFIGDRQETTSTFSGVGGSFATQGFDPAQHSFNVGTKLTLATKGNWSLETNYDFEYKEDFRAHTGWANARYKF